MAPCSSASLAEHCAGDDRRHQRHRQHGDAGDDAAAGQRGDRHADGGVVHGEEDDRQGHLPQHLGVVPEVVERAVAHEHLADEQHDLGQEAEPEEDRGDGPHLGQHVVPAGERPGEDQGQHAVTAIGAHDVGRGEGHEQQQRRRHADVLAVGDELEPLGGRVAGEVADADVHDGRDGDDGQQRPGQHLLAPRPPQAEGPADRGAVQRRGPRPRARRAVRRRAGSRGRRPRRAAGTAAHRRTPPLIARPPGAGRPRRARRGGSTASAAASPSSATVSRTASRTSSPGWPFAVTSRLASSRMSPAGRGDRARRPARR